MEARLLQALHDSGRQLSTELIEAIAKMLAELGGKYSQCRGSDFGCQTGGWDMGSQAGGFDEAVQVQQVESISCQTDGAPLPKPTKEARIYTRRYQ